MAYIGLEPSNSFVSLKRQVITGNDGSSYTLDHSVASVNDVAIFVNNVRQDPASYSISGTALTLGGTISSSDSCYVIFLGQALQTVTPATNSVTTSMLSINGGELNLDADEDTSITADTDDQIDFKTGGTDRLKIDSTDVTVSTGNIVFGTASKGVYLGVTSATAANLLDDYEEGTWTPVVNSANGFSTGITSTTHAKYTKIGNTVNVRAYFQMGNSSGNLALEDNVTITGIPFTADHTEDSICCAYRYNSNNGIFAVYLNATNSIFARCQQVNGTPLRNGGAIALNYVYQTT